MLDFKVDKDKCISCGRCALDCLTRIIDLEGGFPVITAEKEKDCMKCQHCMAVCPVGAISILGVSPEDNRSLVHNFPSADQMETLIRGRRSVRHYKDENVDPKVVARLLDVAWQAPTGKNAREVLFTVIDDREVMNKFRVQAMDALAAVVKEGKLPQGREFFADYVRA